MKLKHIVITRVEAGQRWLGIPGIERTAGGRLYITWFSGGETEPAPENAVFLNWSDDGGRTFGQPVLMAAPADGDRAFDSALWLAPTGVLWLIYNRSNRETGRHRVWVRTCARPDEDAPVWSDPRHIPFDVPYSFRLNKPTVLSSGEWLMPMTYAHCASKEWFAAKHRQNLQGVGMSTDQGKTWSLYGAVQAPPLASENMVVERRGGSLLMYMRTGSGFLWQSESFDKGRTWSEGAPTSVASPGSRFHLRRLPDGDWLLINSPDPTKRTGIEARLSTDEGVTWSWGLMLDERDQVSYPDATVAEDGTIYAVHDRERNAIYTAADRERTCEGAGEILLSVFRKEAFPA